MKILRARKHLADQFRADSPAANNHETAVCPMRKKDLGDDCNHQRIDQAAQEREGDKKDEGALKLQYFHFTPA